MTVINTNLRGGTLKRGRPAPPALDELPELAARSAYLATLGLMAVFMGVYALSSLATFSGELGLPDWSGMFAGWNSSGPVLIVTAIWLTALQRPGSSRARAVLVWILPPAGAALTFAIGQTGQGVGVWCEVVAETWLCLAVAARFEITPRRFGFTPRHGAARRPYSRAVIVFVIVFIVAIGALTWAYWVLTELQSVRSLPQMPGSQLSTLGITSKFSLYAQSSAAGFQEAIVLTAVPVIFLSAARRPAWEIYLLSTLGELVIHLYFGAPALAACVFAVVNVWLLRRTGLLIPIIAAHLAYNMTLDFAGYNTETIVTDVRWSALAVALYAAGWHGLGKLSRQKGRGTDLGAGAVK